MSCPEHVLSFIMGMLKGDLSASQWHGLCKVGDESQQLTTGREKTGPLIDSQKWSKGKYCICFMANSDISIFVCLYYACSTTNGLNTCLEESVLVCVMLVFVVLLENHCHKCPVFVDYVDVTGLGMLWLCLLREILNQNFFLSQLYFEFSKHI